MLENEGKNVELTTNSSNAETVVNAHTVETSVVNKTAEDVENLAETNTAQNTKYNTDI